jgi:ParB family chromosome partitioning protein
MKHRIKIGQEFLTHILEGKKTFEVRKNDRDYQVGDTIYFMPLENDRKVDVYADGYKGQDFTILYVHQGLGMQEGYCVLGIKQA